MPLLPYYTVALLPAPQPSDAATALHRHHLEQLVLKGHVGFRLQADAGTEDIGQSRALLGQCIHDGCARGSERGLLMVSGLVEQRTIPPTFSM